MFDLVSKREVGEGGWGVIDGKVRRREKRRDGPNRAKSRVRCRVKKASVNRMIDIEQRRVRWSIGSWSICWVNIFRCLRDREAVKGFVELAAADGEVG